MAQRTVAVASAREMAERRRQLADIAKRNRKRPRPSAGSIPAPAPRTPSPKLKEGALV